MKDARRRDFIDPKNQLIAIEPIMNQTTFIGLDLGSFQTSAIASNGQRYLLPSAVAWPNDVFWDDVAAGICQFGDHLTETNPELDVIYPMQKGAFKFLDATETGLDKDRAAQARHSLRMLARHAVCEVAPMSSLPVYGVIGCPVRASDANRRLLLECVHDLFSGLMIVADPILIAFATARTKDALVIDIGAGTTDISPIVDGKLITTECISLPMGGDWIEDVLEQEILTNHKGLPVPRNTLREIKEVFGTLFSELSPATVTVVDDDQQFDLNVRAELTTACRILGPSISNAIRETLSAFDSETAERLVANTVLSGGTSQLEGVDELINQPLSEFGTANVSVVDDKTQVCAQGACLMASAISEQRWAQLAQLNAPQELLRAA
jgi:actin-like ATPase involved in cell morphogenesis